MAGSPPGVDAGRVLRPAVASLALVALLACAETAPPEAAPTSPPPTTASASPTPESEPTESVGPAVTPKPLTFALPAQGLVVEYKAGVRLVALDGRVLARLPGLQLASYTSDPEREVRLVNTAEQFFAVAAGARTFPRVAQRTTTPQELMTGCAVSDRRDGIRYLVCDGPRDGDAAIVRIDAAGRRRVLVGAVPGPPDGKRTGRWRWVLVSPGGGRLMAQWSGECEVPSTFLLSTSGAGLRRPEGGKLEHDVTTHGLGWTPRGDAVVQYDDAACGTGIPRPGVYLVTEGSRSRLVVANTGRVLLWGAR